MVVQSDVPLLPFFGLLQGSLKVFLGWCAAFHKDSENFSFWPASDGFPATQQWEYLFFEPPLHYNLEQY